MLRFIAHTRCPFAPVVLVCLCGCVHLGGHVFERKSTRDWKSLGGTGDGKRGLACVGGFNPAQRNK